MRSAKLLAEVETPGGFKTRLVVSRADGYPAVLILENSVPDAMGQLSWHERDRWRMDESIGIGAILAHLCKQAGLL